MQEFYNEVFPKYEISRFIFSNGGIHRIGFTKRKEKITSKEKLEWLERLKNYMSVVELEGAKKIQDGFSLSK